MLLISFFFFFNDTATTEIYTLSLHDALPISPPASFKRLLGSYHIQGCVWPPTRGQVVQLRHKSIESRSLGLEFDMRSEEHTSELQSRLHLVCRLLLEKKKKNIKNSTTS